MCITIKLHCHIFNTPLPLTHYLQPGLSPNTLQNLQTTSENLQKERFQFLQPMLWAFLLGALQIFKNLSYVKSLFMEALIQSINKPLSLHSSDNYLKTWQPIFLKKDQCQPHESLSLVLSQFSTWYHWRPC